MIKYFRIRSIDRAVQFANEIDGKTKYDVINITQEYGTESEIDWVVIYREFNICVNCEVARAVITKNKQPACLRCSDEDRFIEPHES